MVLENGLKTPCLPSSVSRSRVGEASKHEIYLVSIFLPSANEVVGSKVMFSALSVCQQCNIAHDPLDLTVQGPHYT